MGLKTELMNFYNGWNKFCKVINFGDSAMDNDAIVFMNEFKKRLNEFKDFDMCDGCPGSTNPLLSRCSIYTEINQMKRMHSGLDGIQNQMQIKVTECHHKARMLKEAE